MNSILSIVGEREGRMPAAAWEITSRTRRRRELWPKPGFFRLPFGIWKVSFTALQTSVHSLHDMFYDGGDKGSTHWRICLHVWLSCCSHPGALVSNHLIYFITPAVCASVYGLMSLFSLVRGNFFSSFIEKVADEIEREIKAQHTARHILAPAPIRSI